MKEDFITLKQSKILKKMGFDWECDYIYAIFDLNERLVSKLEFYDACLFKLCDDHYFAPTIYQTMKWMREEMGIDIVISPKFNSKTGDRVGYFWRWSQRTDVNMNPKTHKTYEKAVLDAINTIISPFEELYNTDKSYGS